MHTRYSLRNRPFCVYLASVFVPYRSVGRAWPGTSSWYKGLQSALMQMNLPFRFWTENTDWSIRLGMCQNVWWIPDEAHRVKQTCKIPACSIWLPHQMKPHCGKALLKCGSAMQTNLVLCGVRQWQWPVTTINPLSAWTTNACVPKRQVDFSLFGHEFVGKRSEFVWLPCLQYCVCLAKGLEFSVHSPVYCLLYTSPWCRSLRQPIRIRKAQSRKKAHKPLPTLWISL